MIFKDKKVIIFDLDGTLIDSVPDLTLAVNNMLQTLDKGTHSEKMVREWVGNGVQVLVKRALSGKSEIDENLDIDLVHRALDIFLKSYKNNLCVNTVLYPNVLEILQNLLARGFRLALVTNKPFAFIEPLLIGLGIDNIFELCLGGDSLSKKKPDPMPLLHVCDALGVKNNECLMIGDSKNDILAAKSANIESIAVSYGYNYNEDISTYEPESVVNEMSEVCALIEDNS